MDKFKRYLPALLVLCLAGLVAAFPSLVFNYLIRPIAVLLWAAWRMVLTVDQSTYWLVVIIFCLLLIVRFASPAKKRASHPAYHYKVSPVSRVEYWQRLIDESASGDKEAASLRDRLEELVFSAVAPSHRPHSTGLQEITALDQVALPDEVHRYLFPGPVRRGLFPGTLAHRFRKAKWLQTWNRNFAPPDSASIDEVLRWVENYLEINHDR